MAIKIANSEPMTDKVFLRLVLPSILAIFLCIICICSLTWAWFSDAAPSAENQIQVASDTLLEIAVTRDGTPLADLEGDVLLESGVDYTVTLSLPANTASGYYIVKTGGASYYGAYIARHGDALPQTATFTLRTETTRVVQFEKHWGIYSCESHVVDGVMLIP